MTPRVKAEFWVKAHLRRVEIAGAQAFIARRGDADAGSVLIVVNRLDGSSQLLVSATRQADERVWLSVTGADPAPDAAVRSEIERRVARDPDLWVLEIEDKAGRAFLDEPIDVIAPRGRVDK